MCLGDLDDALTVFLRHSRAAEACLHGPFACSRWRNRLRPARRTPLLVSSLPYPPPYLDLYYMLCFRFSDFPLPSFIRRP